MTKIKSDLEELKEWVNEKLTHQAEFYDSNPHQKGYRFALQDVREQILIRLQKSNHRKGEGK